MSKPPKRTTQGARAPVFHSAWTKIRGEASPCLYGISTFSMRGRSVSAHELLEALERAPERVHRRRVLRLAEMLGVLILGACAQIARRRGEVMSRVLGRRGALAHEVSACRPRTEPGVVVAHAGLQLPSDAVDFADVGSAVRRGAQHGEHLRRPAVVGREIHEVVRLLGSGGCCHDRSFQCAARGRAAAQVY